VTVLEFNPSLGRRGTTNSPSNEVCKDLHNFTCTCHLKISFGGLNIYDITMNLAKFGFNTSCP
jgi:hypothetical protein